VAMPLLPPPAMPPWLPDSHPMTSAQGLGWMTVELIWNINQFPTPLEKKT
jgi:hypothetical protein